MSRVECETTIAAKPADVWAVALDPRRLGDWVTIHQKLHSHPDRELRQGDELVQTLSVRGAPVKVKWKVVELDAPIRAVWEGAGPARSKARTEYRLEAVKGGTRFHYVNEFKPPGGPLGRIAGNVLVGGIPEQEAHASLEKLAALLEG